MHLDDSGQSTRKSADQPSGCEAVDTGQTVCILTLQTSNKDKTTEGIGDSSIQQMSCHIVRRPTGVLCLDRSASPR